MSIEGEKRFRGMLERVNAIVRKRVRKYNLASLDPDDLMQEGRLAAAYAVDTFTDGRGNLDGYISTVVSNALAMVAAEALAQARQPYKSVQDFDGSWRKVPVCHIEIEDDTAIDETIAPAIAREESRHLAQQTMSLEQKLANLKLSIDAKHLLQLRLHTPPELWVLARNMNRGRMKLEAQSVCRYMGWMLETGDTDRLRYQRTTRELREQFRFVLGVDDISFEPLKPTVIRDQHLLLSGAKCRNLQELRA